MNNTIIMDDGAEPNNDSPGAILAAQRINLDYSVEYVADKLHLRVRVIELLEANDYDHMPEPVFIKGYLRAYAKLVGISSDHLLNLFNQIYSGEKKVERALWQSKRESNKAEYFVRWFTTSFAVIVLIAVAMWWQSSKENENIFSSSLKKVSKSSSNVNETEIRLTDLSKMRSILSSPVHEVAMDTNRE